MVCSATLNGTETSTLSPEEEEREAKERSNDRSRNLAILFGFYTFGLFSFAVIGVLLSLSLIGVNVFQLSRLRNSITRNYQTF